MVIATVEVGKGIMKYTKILGVFRTYEDMMNLFKGSENIKIEWTTRFGSSYWSFYYKEEVYAGEIEWRTIDLAYMDLNELCD